MNLKLQHWNSLLRPVKSPSTLCRVSQTSHWSPEEGGGPEEPWSSSSPARRQSWPGLHQYRGIQAEYEQPEVEHPAGSNTSWPPCQLAILLMTILCLTETSETTWALPTTAVRTEDTTAIYCPSQLPTQQLQLHHFYKLLTSNIQWENLTLMMWNIYLI